MMPALRRGPALADRLVLCASQAEKATSLAKVIRSAGETDQHDLAGYSDAACADLCKAAFAQPIGVPAGCGMIRLSFVVGGGKKVRQKYSDSLARALSDALVGVGYVEDRGASLDPSSAGSFKLQHDTDKDLKFMHVFPNVKQASAGDDEDDEDDDEGARFLRMSPADRCCVCSSAELEELVPVVARQFAAKRELLDALKARLKESEALEAKMGSGGVLSDKENERYEGAVDMHDKIAWVQGECERMIKDGELTESEKKSVVAQLDDKLAAASAALEDAAGNAKRAEKLSKVVASLTERKASVSAAPPIVHALPDAGRLRVLYKELADLEKIENAKGLQSMAVLSRLNNKPAVEEELAELEDACRGWFERDTDTEAQLKRLKQNASKPAKGKSGGAGGSGGSRPGTGASSFAGFTPVGVTSASRGGPRGGGAKKKASAASSGGNAFDALGDFMDADNWG